MILFTLLYAYQGLFMIIGIICKPKKYVSKKNHKFAVIIPARNEETVIGKLIDNICAQNYPEELVDIYLLADNCTDATAEIGKLKKVNVYERFNDELIGKGYALDEFFKYLDKTVGIENYDAYMFFDADNILEPNFITEINNVFDNGFEIVTGFRNTKNYDASWVASSSGTWFLRECIFMSKARMKFLTTTNVTGTGFLVSSKILKEIKGWTYHLLTEDIEFSMDMVLKDKVIGYAHEAVYYDEQPVKFKDSWNQRLRWVKGFYQVLKKYGAKLIKRSFVDGDFGSYDMFMLLAPGNAFTLIIIGVNSLFFIIGLLDIAITGEVLKATLHSVMNLLENFFVIFFTIGVATTLSERKRIKGKKISMVKNVILFPIYMLSYIPISILAFFKKVKWVPIKHTDVKDIKDI